ncbi:MAG: pantoate--beta-alanine ligase [Bacteroidota bacterium]|nr:pantoate--beta-alanine ligase [Bacteroidota bacterium]
MKIISSVSEMQIFAEELRRSGKRIGLVPTMGFLHEGHLSLVRRAREISDAVVVSIFVNPAQFAPGEDFERYPRDIERDKSLLQSEGVAVLFTPGSGEMYPQRFSTYIIPEGISSVLEGKFRSTHFRGVATVVGKLFLIVQPHAAVFGQKDAQQSIIIKQMVRDLNFNLQIIVAPIVREQDGLALSSRNVYLSPEERNDAPILFQALQKAEALIHTGETDAAAIIHEVEKTIRGKKTAAIDYVAVNDAESLTEMTTTQTGRPVLISLAVRFGKTRLIDNIIVQQ